MDKHYYYLIEVAEEKYENDFSFVYDSCGQFDANAASHIEIFYHNYFGKDIIYIKNVNQTTEAVYQEGINCGLDLKKSAIILEWKMKESRKEARRKMLSDIWKKVCRKTA